MAEKTWGSKIGAALVALLVGLPIAYIGGVSEEANKWAKEGGIKTARIFESLSGNGHDPNIDDAANKDNWSGVWLTTAEGVIAVVLDRKANQTNSVKWMFMTDCCIHVFNGTKGDDGIARGTMIRRVKENQPILPGCESLYDVETRFDSGKGNLVSILNEHESKCGNRNPNPFTREFSKEQLGLKTKLLAR